jgi:hypothetical protein
VRNSESPFAIDWFAVSLRWLFMLGLSISMARGGGLTLAASLLLAILGIWNLILTILAGMSRRIPAHRQISLGIDFIAAAGYFIFQGGFSGPAAWIIILPLFSASLYFEIPGALIMAAILAATQLGFTLYQTLEIKTAMFAGLGSIATFSLAALFGFLSKRLNAHIIKDNLTREENEQKRFTVETERLRAIYKLTSTMMSTLSYQRVIDSLLDLSLAVMNADPTRHPMTAWLEQFCSFEMKSSKWARRGALPLQICACLWMPGKVSLLTASKRINRSLLTRSRTIPI